MTALGLRSYLPALQDYLCLRGCQGSWPHQKRCALEARTEDAQAGEVHAHSPEVAGVYYSFPPSSMPRVKTI